MKSLKSIAQQKGFELSKLEKLAEENTSLQPVKMGSTSLYSTDDAQTLVSAYYQNYLNADA